MTLLIPAFLLSAATDDHMYVWKASQVGEIPLRLARQRHPQRPVHEEMMHGNGRRMQCAAITNWCSSRRPTPMTGSNLVGTDTDHYMTEDWMQL
jgi:hypothetical protein